MYLAYASGNDSWHGSIENWGIKIFITDSQSECDPRNKFLDTLRNNYEYNFPFTVRPSPKTKVALLVLLGMQGVKRGEIRCQRGLFSFREPENKVDDNGHCEDVRTNSTVA
jgi:hypothetical protein